MIRSLIRRISAVLALTVPLLSCGMVGGNSAQEDPRPVSVSTGVLQRLEGNYSMKIVSEGKTRYSTATVKELATGQFQIARVTVYGPVYYGFLLSEDGTVHSEELGDGTVSYKESIDKTTIRFEREDSICELTR